MSLLEKHRKEVERKLFPSIDYITSETSKFKEIILDKTVLVIAENRYSYAEIQAMEDKFEEVCETNIRDIGLFATSLKRSGYLSNRYITGDTPSHEEISSFYNSLLKLMNTQEHLVQQFKSLKSEMIASFLKNSKNKDLILSLESEYDHYLKKMDNIHSLFNSLLGLLSSDEKQLTASFYGDKDSLSKSLGRKIRIAKRVEIGKKSVYIVIKQDFLLVEDKVSGVTLITGIIDHYDFKFLNQFKTAEEGKKIRELLNSGDLETIKKVEENILYLYLNTVIKILENNQNLIKATNTKIYIEITTEEKLKAAGTYESSISDFVEIFINVAITNEVLNDFCAGSSLITDRETEETIIHEMIHSGDNKMDTNRPDLIFAYRLAMDPKPPIVSLIDLIESLRTEALAMASVFFTNEIKDHGYFINLGDCYLKSLKNAKKEIDDLLINGTFKAPEEIRADVRKTYKEGDIHTYGLFMVTIVFIDRYIKDLIFWRLRMAIKKETFWEVSPADFEDRLERHYLAEKLTPNDLDFNKVADKVYMQIPPEKKQIATQFINYISSLDCVDFYESFLESCGRLKVDPYPFREGIFEDLNNSIGKETKTGFLKRIYSIFLPRSGRS